ncbi:MAG TPA: hypothetical protein VK973_05790 [Arenicellales bacterium]|nr:hypothetical protein [Arenicellales bacterium]
MWRRILMRVTDRLPAREIKGPDGEPYLERYYVGHLFGWTFYLHRFLAADPGRGLHDHPWDVSVSLVLSGGYYETRLRRIDCTGIHTRRRRLWPGRLNIIRADDFHRVDLDTWDAGSWTLFATHRRLPRKRLGFLQQEMISGDEDIVVRFMQHYGRSEPNWQRTAPTGRELRRQQNARQGFRASDTH